MVKADRIHLIWLQGQGCTGCTVSLTSAAYPSLVDLLTGFIPQASGITLDYHLTLQVTWGGETTKVLKFAEEGNLDPFVLALEGAVPDENLASKTGGHWCVLGEDGEQFVTVSDWVNRLSRKTAAAVAIGTCASFGGIPHGHPNPTGSKGLMDFLGRDWKSSLGLPVISMPGCPVPGQSLVEILAQLVLAVRGYMPLPELDEYHRPKSLFDTLVHESCPKAGYYAGGKDAHVFGELGCLGLLGCKGIITHCSLAKDGAECTQHGAPCIGCAEPSFPDPPMSPFLDKAPVMPYVTDTVHGVIGHVRAGLHRLTRRPW